MVSESMVDRLKAAKKEADKAAQRRDRIVRQCRDKGATWTQIGYALGVTAQACQQRYGSTDERTEAYRANLARRAKRRAQKRAGRELSDG